MSIWLGRFRSVLFYLPAILIVVTFSNGPGVLAGESEWVEVRSPNFSVVTDAGEKRGREVAMRFEQMRGVFGALMVKANVNLPVPLQIVAFRNTKEMRQVAPLFNGKPTQLAGLFQSGSDRSFIMLDMSVENPWTVVFHEYAHQLMNGNLNGAYAPWFEEGFAEYFSSIEVDGKEARVGRIPDYTYVILRQAGTMKIADLLRVRQNTRTYNESGDHRSSFYAESGLLMHYIFDNHLMPKVATYFDLTENKHVRVEDAIQQAFGMSAQEFDKTLYSYAALGHYMYYRIPTPDSISSKTYTTTALSAATGNAVLADIHLHSPDYQKQAVTEFQEVLKSDPKNAAACRGLGYAYLQQQDFPHAAEYFRQASQLDSKDPRVHYYNALLMSREQGFGRGPAVPTITEELETSIRLDPNFADSYALLAVAQSTAGKPAEGVATMRKALAISPRNEHYLFNLASLYVANRQPDQAMAVLRSLDASGNPEFASRVTDMLAQVQRFQKVKKAEDEDEDEEEIAEAPVTRGSPPEAKAPSVGVLLQSGPSKFLKGMLTNVDCSTPPLASLSVVSGAKTWKMKVADRNHVILIGADEFSCGWNKQKVAVNYRETSEGNVVSLEIQ
jgi:Flp pilus assembly protein TadD